MITINDIDLDSLTVCEIDSLIKRGIVYDTDVVSFYGNEFWRDNSECVLESCSKCSVNIKMEYKNGK
jgi:hypothetical protein